MAITITGRFTQTGKATLPSPPPGPGDTGVIAGGYYGGGDPLTTIDYITISSESNATPFGALSTARRELAGCSNGASGRGLFSGGENTGGNPLLSVDYVSITTPGAAIDFGDMAVTRQEHMSISNGSNDTGLFISGRTTGGPTINTIDYVTISSDGNAADFGDSPGTPARGSGTSNGTNEMGVIASGRLASATNVIWWVNISSASNGADFGDLTAAREYPAATSNGTSDRAIFAGGSGQTNVVDYITITSTGNASAFGGMVRTRSQGAATSNGTADRGIIAGGYKSGVLNEIDFVTISSAATSVDFGDLTVPRATKAATSDGLA